MSRKLFASVVVLGCGVLLASGPLAAHHSFSGEYDGDQPVNVTGEVRKVEWTNPHIWFYVEGLDEVSGESAIWGFSAGAPGALMRRGIGPNVLQVGDIVKVEGFRAKDRSPNASGGVVTFADGREVFTASAEDPVPD